MVRRCSSVGFIFLLLYVQGICSWTLSATKSVRKLQSGCARTVVSLTQEDFFDPAGPKEDKSVYASIGWKIFKLITGGAETVVGSIQPEIEFPEMGGLVSDIDSAMKDLDICVGEQKASIVAWSEFCILATACAVSYATPFFMGGALIEPIVPAMAATAAGMCLVSEYTGKTAVANAKQVAAEAVKAAAESEAALVQAEKAKCVLTVSVGVGAIIVFLVPIYFTEIAKLADAQISTEAYIGIPAFAVLSAAVAGLANKEVINSCVRASNIGRRRFAASDTVTEEWLSVTEMVRAESKGRTLKWLDFVKGVGVGPFIGLLAPGPLNFKAIIAAVASAAQTAYYLSTAEYSLSQAIDNVSFKSRCASIAETYANQGARSGAILSYTSALGGLMAALSAGIVLVCPYIKSVKMQGLVCLLPTFLGSVLASAASASKSRCQVDNDATSQAIDFRVQFDSGPAKISNANEVKRTVDNPFSRLMELIKVTYDVCGNTVNKWKNQLTVNNPEPV